MKGVVLAAGNGKRLLPITQSCPKPLIPVAGKTLLEHNIVKLIASGICDIAVVIPKGYQPLFENVVAPYSNSHNCRFTFIEQDRPLGTAYALQLSCDFVGNSVFFLCFCDNLTHYNFSKLTAAHEGQKSAATMALVEVSDPSKHGVAEVDGDRVVNLIEKPSHPKSNLVFAGMCIFEPLIFEAVAKTPPSQSGEYYLPDSIRILINSGQGVYFDKVSQWRMNVNTHRDLLKANSYLLNGSETENSRPLLKENLRHRHDYMIVPPVYVSDESDIGSDAVLGPSVSLHGNVRVGQRAKVQNSLLMDGAVVGAERVVSDSIIGSQFELNLGKGGCG